MENKKKVAAIIMVLIVGGVTGHKIDDAIEKYNLQTERYPMKVEYEIIDKCISNDDEPLEYELYGNKRNVCICALEKTELEYGYNLFQQEKSKFLSLFEKNALTCASQ